MLVWLTQLGLSVAVPLGGFTMLGVWLHEKFALGVWIVLLGICIGLISAVDGLRTSLKAMEQMDKRNAKTSESSRKKYNSNNGGQR